VHEAEDIAIMKTQCTFRMVTAVTAGVVSLAALGAQSRSLPALKRQVSSGQPSPEKVVEEHLAAFNACDWNRLMAQFPDNVEFFSPHGAVVRGRKALGEMFAHVVKPPSEGGTCGLRITVEHTFLVGETVNVQWRAEAPFLAEPYRGADAYETHDGLMAAQVTTFDQSELKMKGVAGR
jgi:hypothetical protein